MSELDRLLEAAAGAEPDDLTQAEIDAEIGLAQITGRARHRAWVRRRLFLATSVGTALAAAAVLLFMVGPGHEAPPPRSATQGAVEAAPAEPDPSEMEDRTDLELPTGDRLRASRGAHFRVDSATLAERRIRLLSGAMLFDVRPSARGHFHVETSDAQITVVGTVFTVSAEPSGTIIRVYEGRVEVTHGDTRELIRAGESMSVPTGIGTLEHRTMDPLAEDARRAVAHRLSTPREEPAAPARPSASRPARARSASAAEVRGWITEGRARRALRVAREHVARGDVDPWALLEADALRGLGERDEAARAYTRAASLLPTPRREQAGFTGARLHRSPQASLHALDVGEVSRPGSPLRERALAMRADLLERLGRRGEQAEVARQYLESYPAGSRREHMQTILRLR